MTCVLKVSQKRRGWRKENKEDKDRIDDCDE
jgi:hypothetical protein